jgi:hypothetical protein
MLMLLYVTIVHNHLVTTTTTTLHSIWCLGEQMANIDWLLLMIGMMMPAIDLTTARSVPSIHGSSGSLTDRSARGSGSLPNGSSFSSTTARSGASTGRRSVAATTGAAVMGETKRAASSSSSSSYSNTGSSNRRSTMGANGSGNSGTGGGSNGSGAMTNLIKSPYDGPASARPRTKKLNTTASSSSREEKTPSSSRYYSPFHFPFLVSHTITVLIEIIGTFQYRYRLPTVQRTNPRERVEQRMKRTESAKHSTPTATTSMITTPQRSPTTYARPTPPTQPISTV